MTISTHPDDVRVVPDWELCDRLRRSMRLVRGLDNHDVADFLGCAPATVSTWLNGRRTPNKPTVMMWADMTGVDREWLLTGRPSKYAIRDSNPEPADWEPGQLAPVYVMPLPSINRGLMVDRRAA